MAANTTQYSNTAGVQKHTYGVYVHEYTNTCTPTCIYTTGTTHVHKHTYTPTRTRTHIRTQEGSRLQTTNHIQTIVWGKTLLCLGQTPFFRIQHDPCSQFTDQTIPPLTTPLTSDVSLVSLEPAFFIKIFGET